MNIFYMKDAFAGKAINLRQQSISVLKAMPSIHSNDIPTLTETQSDIDFNQTNHIRLQQTFSGYPVWGADIVVHVPHGNNRNFKEVISSRPDSSITMTGTIYQDLDKDLKNKPDYTFKYQQ